MQGFPMLIYQVARGIFTYTCLRSGHTEKILREHPGIDPDHAAKAGAKAALNELSPVPKSKESLFDFMEFLGYIALALFGLLILVIALVVWK